MKRSFKNIDLFGYPIHLKFEKNEGPKYKTLVGAFMTVVFMIMSMGIVYLVFSPNTSSNSEEIENQNENDSAETLLENLRLKLMPVALDKDIIDKIGSVGGTIFLLHTIFEFIVTSYSRFSFKNRMIKRLYFGRVS